MNFVRGILFVVAALWFLQPASAQDNRSYVSISLADPKLQEAVNKEAAEFYKAHCKLYEALGKAATRQFTDANALIAEARSSFSRISGAFADFAKQNQGALKVLPNPEAQARLTAYGLSIPKTYGDVLNIVSLASSRAGNMLSEVKFDGTKADYDQLERVRNVSVHIVAIVATAISVTANNP